MIETPASLAGKGLITPSSIVWRVRFVFADGSDRVVCVSPGRISEESAVEKAKTYARIMDESVLDRIDATRVERDLEATPFGVRQK